MPTACSRILLIINPAAGQDDPAATVERIAERLQSAGAEYEIRETRGEGDALEWARTATGFDRVLVGGGDGTVMEAMSGLIKNEHAIPLAQLPLGTANLLAKALAIPSDLDAALAIALQDGVTVSMDVGYLPNHDRYFALVAGSGWDADLIDDADRKMKDRLGFFAYIVTGVKNLFSLKNSKVQVTIDGRTRKFRAHTVMVINVGEIYGTGIALGDDMSPHDGKLNLAVASPSSPWGIVKLVWRLLTKRFDSYADLRYFSASHIKVSARPPLRLEVDGEAIGETPFEVAVVPDGARLVVPREYAAAKQLEAAPLPPWPSPPGPAQILPAS